MTKAEIFLDITITLLVVSTILNGIVSHSLRQRIEALEKERPRATP